MAVLHAIKVTTSDVIDELKRAAVQWHLPLDGIDFDLLSYRTYYRGSIDEEWCLLQASRLDEITTEKEIRSSTFFIRQEYHILIRPYQANPHFDLRFSIATDKQKTKGIAVIDPSSTIPLKKGVQEWIKKAIYRKKLRAGFMIGITDGNLDKEINRMLLKMQKEGGLDLLYRLPIAEFYPPVLPVDDTVLLHYKKIQRDNNLIDGVQPNDLILEYVFATRGSDGRSCTGDHIHVDEPRIRYANAVVIDPESIRAEEDEHSIRYYAIQSGYVERKNGIFTIGHELRLEEASFKKTGSIEAGSEKDIHIKIQHKDQYKDAIGSGVNIDVQTLDVNGTIGSNTKIQARDVNIGAQTHKKSHIEAEENASVHLHRGHLKAKEATIEILEAGRVEAETVTVQKMSGGEIIANRVFIDTLYSNAKITALESIEIKTILGDGNDLSINPYAIASYQEQITELDTEVKTKTLQLQQKSKEFILRELAWKDKSSRMAHLQERVENALRENRPPLKADTIHLQQYQREAAELENQKTTLHAHEESLHEAQRTLEKLYDADLHACITYHGEYNGLTRIHFIDPKTHHVHALTPKGKITHIRLQKKGDEKKFVFES